MDFISETVERGVVERRFDLKVGDNVVPGIIWTPEDAAATTPTILIGHGGTQHKRVPNVLSLARRLVRHQRYAAVAIDAPDHGDRVVDVQAAETARRALEQRLQAGKQEGGGPRPAFAPETARAWAERIRLGVLEWKATVDAIQPLTGGPLGYWGVSMGTVIGLPFVASEPRVSAAVLGLAGLSGRPGGADFEAAARSLTTPVLMLFQWDDELASRESGLALYDAFASAEKSLHINPGGHIQIPFWERDATEAFFVRHLGPPR